MQQPSLSLKASGSRRQPTFEPVDADERQLQAEHHEAAENAAQAANEARTGVQTDQAVPKPRGNPNEAQSAFLSRNLGRPVTVYLVNGIKLTARLRQYDQFSILLENGNEQLLVFKHAISTVIPTTR